MYYWQSLSVNLKFGDKLEEFSTSILNLNLISFIFFNIIVFQVANMNCSAYLKIDGFLRLWLNFAISQDRNLIPPPKKNEELHYSENSC